MSYSLPQSTYQVKESENNNHHTVSVAATTSPQREVYNKKLMYFVYEQVLAAFDKKTKENLSENDLNSATIIITAEKKAIENLGRSLI